MSVSESSCKICFETGDSEQNGQILNPCMCTGTCKNIHEECLKEWILTKHF